MENKNIDEMHSSILLEKTNIILKSYDIRVFSKIEVTLVSAHCLSPALRYTDRDMKMLMHVTMITASLEILRIIPLHRPILS